MRRGLIVAVMFLVALSSSALAEGNTITLESSNVKDGQRDVPVDTVIELVFSNNVVDESVAKNNEASIILINGEWGVAVYIEMADDQIEPDMKRTILVRPVLPLRARTSYELIIRKALRGKNGNTLGEEVTISFTTQKAARSKPNYTMLIIFMVAIIILVAINIVKWKHRTW